MEKKQHFTTKKKFLGIGGAIIILVLIIGLIATFTPQKEYVASINGEKITSEELNELLMSQYGEDVLDSLITQKVIEMEMEKNDIEITQDEMDAELAEYEAYYGGKEAFQALLESSGIDISYLEKDIELYLGSKKLMENEIEITEEEMETYFEDNKADFDQKEAVEASHILVEDEETAKDIIAKLNAGEDFATLAKEYSTDSATAENGGELGYFEKGEMVEAFEEAAFALEVGTYTTQPIQTDYGYHIIKVTDYSEEKEATYDDVKEEIKEILFEEKADLMYSTWIQEVMTQYEIENYIANEN